MESATKTVTVAFNAVNDAPGFQLQARPNQAVNEDAGTQGVTGFVTTFTAGPSNEIGQTVTFLVSNDNRGLFTSQGQPSIDSNGTLTYRSAPDASGSATVYLKAKDTGGTANGGMDASSVQSFTITVRAADRVAPTVIKVAPTGKKVSPKANVVATFSEAMMRSSLNRTTVKLVKKGATKKVVASLSYPAPNKVVLNPKGNLMRGVTYKVAIVGGPSGAKDLVRNAQAANKVWTFKVR
jgi:hypothetical protein